MYLKHLEITGFKSFAKKGVLDFSSAITSIVGPNGSGKSNVAEAMRFVLGEQSLKSMRGKRGEDLIFNGSKNTSRSNRASVSIVFDNKDRKFSQNSELGVDVDFDEVTLTREVYRDGTNQYSINGSQVRLRDILNFLSSMNIGSSGHHIISQGEADRVLNANPKEKRMMIEDALGLKIYHYKKNESEKKLAKTRENIQQVELQRKEIAPHLRFLKRQVEKIEKSQILRDDLKEKYLIYLKKEENYLKSQKESISKNKTNLQTEISRLEKELEESEKTLNLVSYQNTKLTELREKEKELGEIRNQKDNLSRQIGRIEGMIELEIKREKEKEEKLSAMDDKMIPLKKVKGLISKIKEKISSVSSREDISEIKNGLANIKDILEEFVSLEASSESISLEISSGEERQKMEEEKSGLDQKLTEFSQGENDIVSQISKIREEIEKEKDSYRDIEKKVFEIRTQRNSLLSNLEINKREEEDLRRGEERFNEELSEGSVLVGRSILNYGETKVDEENDEEREIQENHRREIEKMKIRLEDMIGGESAEDSLKEYQEVTERDQFLEREIEDLIKSAESLEFLIKDLTEKLDTEFKNGVIKINKQFQEFFALMFGGGTALLSLFKQKVKKKSDTDIDLDDYEDEEEKDEGEEGIEIEVSLPHKKTKGLQMLSGGERALTSIALLFAISQVNPPPFLVLDETDAALDEANSRKYGDMLENLSKYSQLIVVTHNRETMSRAGVLYGVTMGADATSKLLSIKFDEAVEVAK